MAYNEKIIQSTNPEKKYHKGKVTIEISIMGKSCLLMIQLKVEELK
jgi:hypothetical protein